MFDSQEVQKQRYGMTMANGFILPEGKMTPNTLFVGGIDMKVGQPGLEMFPLHEPHNKPKCGLLSVQVEENEIRDFFARYGEVKEVKIITYRGGICKG